MPAKKPNEVMLVIAGDTSSLDKALAAAISNVNKLASQTGSAAADLTSSFTKIEKSGKSAATGFDHLEASARSAKGNIKGFGSTLSGLDTLFGTNLGSIKDLLGGLKSLAAGVAGFVAPALEKVAAKFGFMTTATVVNSEASVASAVTQEGLAAAYTSEAAAAGVATVATEGFTVALLANPVTLIIAGVVALAAAVWSLTSIFSKSAGPTEASAKALTSYASAASEAKAMIYAVSNAERASRDGKKAIASATTEHARAVRDLNKLNKDGAVDEEKVAAAQKVVESTSYNLAKAHDAVTAARKAYNLAMKPATERELADAQDNITESGLKLTSAQIKVREAQKNLIKVQKDSHSSADDITQAKIAVTQAELDVHDAVNATKDATLAQTEVQKQGTAADKDVISTKATLNDALYAERDASNAAKDAQKAKREAQAGDPAFADKLADAQNRVADSNDRYNDAVKDFPKLNDDWLAAIEKKRLYLLEHPEVNSVGDVDIQKYLATHNADGSTKKPSPSIVERIGGAGLAVANAPINLVKGLFGIGHAGGGQIDGPTMVGENGPEIFSGKGYITPNHRLTGGGNNYSITVQAWDTKDGGQAVVDAIRKYESSNGRTWRTK